MPDYAIVEFINDGVIDIISTSWMIGRTKCKFPCSSSAEKLMINHTNPSATTDIVWEDVPIRIISLKSTLLEARKRLKKVRDSSDDETIDLDGKRKRKTPGFYMFENSKCRRRLETSSSDNDDNDTSDFFANKTFPSKEVFLSSPSTTSSNVRSIDHEVMGSTSTTTNIFEQCNSSQDPRVSTPVAPLNDDGALKQYSMGDIKVIYTNYQTALLSELKEIKQLVQENSRCLSALTENRGLRLDLPCALPLTSMAHFNQLNEWAKQEENGNNLAKQLSMAGGLNVNDVCRRVLKGLMTMELVVQFSLTGRKGTKVAFNKSALYGVVLQSVTFTNKSFNEKHIENGLKEIFNNAKDRLKAQR